MTDPTAAKVDTRSTSVRAAEAVATAPGLWGSHLDRGHRMDAATFALAVVVDGHTIAEWLDLLGPLEAVGEYQRRAVALIAERWPDDTLAERVMALAEEGSEVAELLHAAALDKAVGRAMQAALKSQASHVGYRTDTDWTARLRLEVGQVGFVIASIAEAAGFDLWAAMSEAIDAVEAKPTASARDALLAAARQDAAPEQAL